MMPSRRHILAAPAAALALPAHAARPTVPTPAAVRAWMALAAVPGASWAILTDGQTATHAEGDALAGQARATTDTLFEAQSLSKPVLAAAVHDLVGEGRIDLDAPVARHVDFTTDALARTITPRHLLSHASGLLNWRTEAGETLTCQSRPGAAFRYSGEGYVLLARLVEAVTGRTAAEVVRRRILMPAGMTRSSYGWAPGQSPAVATPHDAGGDVIAGAGPALFRTRRDAGPARPVEYWTQADRIAAATAIGKPALPLFMMPNMAAGLWTTAGDYARFLRFARRYPAMNTPTVRVAGPLWWGLGWGIERQKASSYAWHWGANDGVANVFVLNPASGDGLVMLTNGAGGQRVYERAARTHFAREFDALTWLQP